MACQMIGQPQPLRAHQKLQLWLEGQPYITYGPGDSVGTLWTPHLWIRKRVGLKTGWWYDESKG